MHLPLAGSMLRSLHGKVTSRKRAQYGDLATPPSHPEQVGEEGATVMFTRLGDTSKATIFAVLVLLLALAAALLIRVLDIMGGFGVVMLYMSTPALTVLVMLVVVTRDGYTREGWKVLGLHRLGLKAWWIAFLAPLVDASLRAGRAHLGRLAHAPDLLHTPLPFGGEQNDRCASLRGDHRGGELLLRLLEGLDGQRVAGVHRALFAQRRMGHPGGVHGDLQPGGGQ
jgi:hypothetical protein